MSEKETIVISRFDSIRTRLILAFVLIVLLPMTFISAVLSISGSKGAQLQLSTQLETVVSFKESAINTWVATLNNELADTLIGDSPRMYVRTLVAGPEDSAEHQFSCTALREYFRQLMNHYDALFVMDRSGRVVLSTEIGEEGRIFADRAFFDRGLTKASVVSSTVDQATTFVAVRPLIDQGGLVVGVMAGRARMSPLVEIIRNPTGLGKTGKTFLVGGDSMLLTALPDKASGEYVQSEGVRRILETRIRDFGAYLDYLDKIINSAADPIFVKDRQHRWVLANDAFCAFLDRSRGEILGKSDYDYFPKDEADLLLAESDEDQRRFKLQQIKQTGERARDLTQRLLAFSRKQLIELKTVDLGDLICKFEGILRRTIRENIRIEVRISPSLSRVRADAGQIEQALVNLSINAQDAMPEGGTLTIEARDIDLDESYTDRHPEIVPGAYVMLAVNDTGIGMEAQVIEHIFEPFYTTKELGTGLGLSTVYGIVKQHGGSISVYSEKNHGSMLESLGYQVLSAENPDRCIELVKNCRSTINLLLTDVVMPRMNGKDLYDRLHRMRPDLRVIFMSGYTSNVIGHHGVLDQGTHFIQKPFSIHTLSEKVRHVLDAT